MMEVRYNGYIMEIKGLVANIAGYSRLSDAYASLRTSLTKSHVAILMYHRVCPKEDNWSVPPLSPESFEKQMEYCCRNYEILPLEKVARCMQQRKPLPEKAVVFTLDDGYKDNYTYAYPILKKYCIPATIFLTTGHIGTGNLFWFDKVRYILWNVLPRTLTLDELGTCVVKTATDRTRAALTIIKALKRLPDEEKNLVIEKLFNISEVSIPSGLGNKLILSWDEIREMNSNGIVFGAHSVNHPVLTNLPLEQAKWEIIESKKAIEERLGQPVTAFSYPIGDVNPELIEYVKESGFTCAVTNGTSKLITLKDNPYQLSRISPGEDFGTFKVILSGLWGDLKGILRKERR